MFNQSLYQSLITDVRKVADALRRNADAVTLHNGESLSLTYDVYWQKGFTYWQGSFGIAVHNNLRAAFPRTSDAMVDELNAALFECGF